MSYFRCYRYVAREDDAIIKYIKQYGSHCGSPGGWRGNVIWQEMQKKMVIEVVI